MNVRLLLLPAMAVTLLAGCRRDPHLQVYIDNMNAEKRMLEDTLYDLQYDYDNQVSEIEKLQKELTSLKAGSVSARNQPDANTSKSSDRTPRTLFPDIPELAPPTIDEGVPSGGTNSLPKKPADQNTDPDENPDDLEPPKLDLGEAGDSLSAVPLPADQQVTELHLDPAQTGGFQQNDEPGDDGIVVVLEPRNSHHVFVPQPGRVSVVLLDEDNRSRVALWEFTPADTELALQRAGAGRGMKLTMPWPETPPSQSRLHLFVRYALPDGRTLQQDRTITITPAGQLAARWTPRSKPRPENSTSRVNVAENHQTAAGDAHNSGAAAASEAAWKASSESVRSEVTSETPVKQARRPEWRPYR